MRPSVDRKINPPVTVVEGDGEENFLELVRALEKGKSLGKVREILQGKWERYYFYFFKFFLRIFKLVQIYDFSVVQFSALSRKNRPNGP